MKIKKILFLIALMSVIYCCPACGQDNINNIEDFYGVINNVNDTYCMFVTADILNVREEPNTDSNIIRKLTFNTPVDVIEDIDGWTRILDSGEIQYVKSDYLSEMPLELIPLGNFKITHYCIERYKHICGEGTGITRSGTPVRLGVVSVDPDIIPLGSRVLIDGNIYVAEDIGGMIKGRKIDLAVDTHEHALELGTFYTSVYLIN